MPHKYLNAILSFSFERTTLIELAVYGEYADVNFEGKEKTQIYLIIYLQTFFLNTFIINFSDNSHKYKTNAFGMVNKRT